MPSLNSLCLRRRKQDILQAAFLTHLSSPKTQTPEKERRTIDDDDDELCILHLGEGRGGAERRTWNSGGFGWQNSISG